MSGDSVDNLGNSEEERGREQDEKIENAFVERSLEPLTGETAAEYEKFMQQFPSFDADLDKRIQEAKRRENAKWN